MTSVLLAEDNSEIAELLARALTNSGYDVRHALTGGEALALHRRRSADLLVLDLCTPGLSGADAIEQLREAGDATPIVAVSGACRLLEGEWPPRTAMFTALEAGADAFLAKPFTTKSLLLTMRRLLDQTEVAPPPPASTAEREALCLDRRRIGSSAERLSG